MDVFSVKLNEPIVVYQQHRYLFRFAVAKVDAREATIDVYFPKYFKEDGSAGYLDGLEPETVEIGDPLELEIEGMPDVAMEAGTVQITVASVEGQAIAVYVKVPDGWDAVRMEDIPDDDNERAEE
jgi:hypothetical protein